MSAALQHFKRKFQVSWTTLLAGWRGVGQLGRLVTSSDIAQFALEQLESAPGTNSKLAELATISDADATQIDSYLPQLASPTPSDYQTETRKWVVSLLEKQLQELPDDPLYGLLRLTEFWAALDFPDYSPHQVQGKDNTLTPAEYYTSKNFEKALANHRNWLEEETANLTSAQARHP